MLCYLMASPVHVKDVMLEYCQQNMSEYSLGALAPTVPPDHCKTPTMLTYQILSWIMIGQFVLGLPLNLSVLYIFIFRYETFVSLLEPSTDAI